jgi:hypothetical protein
LSLSDRGKRRRGSRYRETQGNCNVSSAALHMDGVCRTILVAMHLHISLLVLTVSGNTKEEQMEGWRKLCEEKELITIHITLCTSSALTCSLRYVKLLTGFGGSSSNHNSGLPKRGWGLEGSNPPPSPKFRSFDKAKPNSQFHGRYIRNNPSTSRKFDKVEPDCKLSGTPD